MPAADATADPLTALTDPLRLLAQRGEFRRYRKGHRLIQEGDHGDTLFIILSGRVRVFSSGERDREITFGTYGAGCCSTSPSTLSSRSTCSPR